MLFETTKTVKRIIYILPTSDDVMDIDTSLTEKGFLIGEVFYSYSFDDVNWSDWFVKGDFLPRLQNEDNNSLTTFLRVLIVTKAKPNTTFSVSAENYLSVNSITVNGVDTTVCGFEYATDVNIIRAVDNSNIYNPYRGLDNAHHIREQLAKSISDTFGQICTYIPTIPDESTKSIIFKSYKVLSASEPKQLKIMLNIDDDYNGDVQSFQFFADYENMEIEILKQEWHNVFGDIKPTPKDVIYINVFDKMFRIVSSKEDRNFVNRAVAYKLYLGKYQEGVEMNMTNAADAVDDFSQFLAFDDENSVQANDEMEQATGTHDTVEATRPNRDSDENKINSAMIYYSKGMKNVTTGLKYGGIEFQRHMYHDDRTSTQYLSKYSLGDYTGTSYSAITWFKYDDRLDKSIKLFELGEDTRFGEQIYMDKNGYINCHVAGDSTHYLKAEGTPMVEKNYYGVMITRFGDNVVLVVLHSNNGTVTKIQEKLFTSISQPKPLTQMNVFANKFLSQGNIRFLNKSVANKDIINTMVDYSPETKNAIVIDNCRPVVTGLKTDNIY